MKKLTALLAALTLALGLTACGQSTDVPKEEGRLWIMAADFPSYDLARAACGDLAEVRLLLPPGAESHSYEPTPRDIIELRNADVFFYVSEHTETWVTQIIESVSDSEVNIVELAKELGLEINGHEHEHHHDEHEEHEEGETDEHIWTNLETASDMIGCMAEKMGELDPENADYYKDNASAYSAKILDLRDDIRELVSTSKRREIVSGSRFAMKNFTHEFGIEFTAAFDSCVDNTEPSASVMAEIIDKIQTDNIPVIFYEELTEPKIARAVSVETGAEMLLLHSCHNISSDEMKRGETYLSLMRQNYNNLKEALN